MSENNIYKQITNLKTFLPSIVLGVIGIALLVLSDFLDWRDKLSWQSLVRDIGSLLIASVAVATIWELFSKRAFFAEALAASKLVEEINTTGIAGASAKWQGSVNWAKMFKSTNDLKIFFAYGRTWRNAYITDLTEFASRPNTKLTLVLPDSNDTLLMKAICQRMGIKPEELTNRINESKDEFIEIFNKSGKAKDKLQIWVVPFAPTYSYYCFGEKAVFTLYHHRAERTDSPTFIIEKGGTLYKFFESDFDNMTMGEKPRGKKIYPTNGVA